MSEMSFGLLSFPLKQKTRLTDNETITNFQTLLKKRSIYKDKEHNNLLNSFPCTFLNIFQTSFAITYRRMKDKNNSITQGIRISCKHKRSLYAFTENSNDPKARAHYIKYCKILIKITQEAKKQNYNRFITKSNNNIKITWEILKKETGRVHSVEQVPTLLVNDEKLKDSTNMATAFNNFFIKITEKLSNH